MFIIGKLLFVECDAGRYGDNCAMECACGTNAECDNVVGCQCVTGWTDIDGDFACLTDIDECENTDPVCLGTSTCENTPAGSYTCTCDIGQEYDETTCTGKKSDILAIN